MSNKAIAAVVAAALAVGGGVAFVASSGDDESRADVHQMQDGSTHTGSMPEQSHLMDDGQMMGDPEADGGRMGGGGGVGMDH